MEKLMKKITAGFLAVAMILATVFSENLIVRADDTQTEPEFTYTIGEDGYAYITGYTDKTVSELVMPTSITGAASGKIIINKEAFLGNDYPNLKSVVFPVGCTYEFGDKALGYQGGTDGVISDFTIWGTAANGAIDYANSIACGYGYIGTSVVSDTLSYSGTTLEGLYAGGTSIIFTVQVRTDAPSEDALEVSSKDITWYIADESADYATITAYGEPTVYTETDDDNNVTYCFEAQAKVDVTDVPEGDAAITVCAETRSGALSTNKITDVKAPATEVGIDLDFYYYADSKLTAITPLDTFIDGNDVYIDTVYIANDKANPVYFYVSGTSDSEDDPASAYANVDTILVAKNPNKDIEGQMYTGSKAGTATIKVSSASGLISRTYTVHFSRPSLNMTTKVDGTASGEFSILQGDSAALTIGYDSGSDDTCTWTSSNTAVATVSSDGTFSAIGYGNVTITATTTEGKFAARTTTATIVANITRRYQYSTLSFVDNTTDKNDITADGISLAAGTSQNLYVLDLTNDGTNAPNEHITWSVSDASIATITSTGLLTAKSGKNGTIQVIAKADSGVQATMNVKVYVPATAITPDAASYIIPEGQTETIHYTVTPSGSTETVNWVSDNPTAITVVSNEANANGGYDLVIKANAVTSKAIDVTGTTSESGIKTVISVTGATAIPATALNIQPDDNVVRTEEADDGSTVYCVEKNTTVTFTAGVTPSDSNDKYTWTTSDALSPIGTYTVSGNTLTAKSSKTGTVQFTCTTTSGVKDIVTVKFIESATAIQVNTKTGTTKLTSVSLQVGKTQQINASLTPTTSTDIITWTVDGDEADGITIPSATTTHKEAFYITANKIGTYTIKATATSGVYYEITVNVTNPISSMNFYLDDEQIGTNGLILCDDADPVEITAKDIAGLDSTQETSDSISNWKSGTESVATVSGSGTTAIITPVASGSSKITVTTTEGSTFSFYVYVVIPATDLSVSCGDEIVINKNESKTITASLSPATTTDIVTWTSSKDGIVSITTSGSGTTQKATITGLANGSTTITATTASGLEASFDVEVQSVELSNDNSAITAVISGSYTYDYGEKVTPKDAAITVTYKPEGSTSSKTLTKDVDYEIISYNNNINAGTASVTIAGLGNYSGTMDINYTIKPISVSSSMLTIEGVDASYTYTGEEIKPTPIVYCNGVMLEEGTDYDVTYPSTTGYVKVGSYSYRLDFKGNFSNSSSTGVSKTYKIVAKDITTSVEFRNASGKVITTLPSVTYNKTAQKPTVYVYDKDNGALLVEGTDYSIAYTNNTNAGTATATITGKGNYTTGKVTINFTINAASIASFTAASIANQTYTGSALKPSVKLTGTLNGSTVTPTYTVTYSNNTNTGKATVKFTGTGNYTGTKTVYFYILPAKATGLAQSAATASSVTLKWTASKGSVTGYTVYLYNSSKSTYTAKKTVTGTSATITGLSAGTTYKYVIKAYKTVSSTKYYSNSYSAVVSAVTLPGKATVKLTSTTSKTVKATWSAVKGATSYKIWYSTDGSSYKLYKTITGTSVSINGLTGGKKVYIKIKAGVKVAGTLKYGAYSAVKSITVKK